VPVPLNPQSGCERLAQIARHSGARRLIAEPVAAARLAEILDRIHTVPTTVAPAPTSGFPSVQTGDLCLIQYTSGSTGDPKGVQLSHANVIANLGQLAAGMRITAADRFCSWLPLYHDMGLILMTMLPFWLGAGLTLLPSRLTRLQAWLEAIETQAATLTAAPDFAYRYLLRYLREPRRYDLSSLRVALNAAEPVRLSTVRAFEATFGLRNVMLPGYGLAEASVGVSTWLPGTPVRQDQQGVVSVGPAFPGVELRIGSAAEPLATGSSGEILIRSPSMTCGYLNNPAATAALFTPEGFLRTGDLGYLDREGNLYIQGRSKEIIIQGGQTIAPQEAEEVVEQLEDVRQAAAIGIDRAGIGGEQLYIFVEVRHPHATAATASLRLEIVRRLHRHFGFRPGGVILLRPHAIARTANGKLQRSRLRSDYLQDPDWRLRFLIADAGGDTGRQPEIEADQ